jgi:hypothetical protein
MDVRTPLRVNMLCSYGDLCAVMEIYAIMVIVTCYGEFWERDYWC